MTSKFKKNAIRGIVTLFVILIGVNSPFFQVIKSYMIMGGYSYYHKVESDIYKEGIRIHIPGGLKTLKRDYYPFVMTYDTSEEFSSHRNESIDLVVLYNFGTMQWLKGASVLYDETSPYYNSFYGAYIAKFKDGVGVYGRKDDGSLDVESIMDITDFDLKHLVLNSVGCEQPILKYDIIETEEPKYLEIDHEIYQVIDAKMEMSTMWHEVKGDYTAYIQYGNPSGFKSTIDSFATIQGYGRIYIRFDTQKNISYFFYSIATSQHTLDEIESGFISKSTIKVR